MKLSRHHFNYSQQFFSCCDMSKCLPWKRAIVLVLRACLAFRLLKQVRTVITVCVCVCLCCVWSSCSLNISMAFFLLFFFGPGVVFVSDLLLCFSFVCIGFHLLSPRCPLKVFYGTCHHVTPWRCPLSRMPWQYSPTLWSSPTRAGTPPRIHRRTVNCIYTPPKSSAMPQAASGQCHYLLISYLTLLICIFYVIVHHFLFLGFVGITVGVAKYCSIQ